MPIAGTDLLLKYSTTAGSAGNSNTGTAASSLGKYMSTSTIADATLNSLFADYSAVENATGAQKYICIFLLNNHATDPWKAGGVYVASETAGGIATAISLDTTGITAKGSASAQAKTIANVNTAPASQTFTSPGSGSPLLLPADLAAAQCIGIWVRITGLNSASVFPDNIPLGFSGTT